MELVEQYVIRCVHPEWLIQKGEPVFVINLVEGKNYNTLKPFTYIGYTKEEDAIVIPRGARDIVTNRLIVPHSNILTLPR